MNNKIEMSYKIPQMETISRTAKIFNLPEYSIRQLARSEKGKAFTIKFGRKYLINTEKFADFLNCKYNTYEQVEQKKSCNIYPVPVNIK